MATKKKRLTISFSDIDLKNIDFIKVYLNCKQISKVISYSLAYLKSNVQD